MYFKTFNFRMVLDLHRGCKGRTEFLPVHFPVSLAVNILHEYGPFVTPKEPTLVYYFYLFVCFILVSSPIVFFYNCIHFYTYINI